MSGELRRFVAELQWDRRKCTRIVNIWEWRDWIMMPPGTRPWDIIELTARDALDAYIKLTKMYPSITEEQTNG